MAGDKKYRRTCACFKLLKAGKITPIKCIEIMNKIGVRSSENTVGLWLKHLHSENKWKHYNKI